MRTPPLVVAGEALVDIVVPRDGDVTEAVGGSPMNVAVGVARLGVPALLITRVGDDPRGQLVLEHVRSSGVEVSAESVVPGGRTSTATARLDEHGAATYEFDLAWDLPNQKLPEAMGLHIGSLGASLAPGRDAVLDLVRQAADRDMFVSYDPNIRPSLVADVDATWGHVRELASLCHLVKLSDEDAAALQPGTSYENVALTLLAGSRTELVIVTLGAGGAVAVGRRHTVTVAPPARVPVVDTVGAGDSFMAAALASLEARGRLNGSGPLTGMDEAEHRSLLADSIAAAGVTCSRRGANPPTRQELPQGWPGQVLS